MVLLENVNCVIDHALELVLYHCTTGPIFHAVGVVSSVTIGRRNRRSVVNYWCRNVVSWWWWLHGNEDGNFWSRLINGVRTDLTCLTVGFGTGVGTVK